jgi:hypothetical protein
MHLGKTHPKKIASDAWHVGAGSAINRVTLTAHRSLPVFPEQQTSAAPVGMSQRCHERK